LECGSEFTLSGVEGCRFSYFHRPGNSAIPSGETELPVKSGANSLSAPRSLRAVKSLPLEASDVSYLELTLVKMLEKHVCNHL